MGVGLQPLEFTECLADSPQFRENLQRHEKELERTSQQIKRLIKEVKDVVQAANRKYPFTMPPPLHGVDPVKVAPLLIMNCMGQAITHFVMKLSAI